MTEYLKAIKEEMELFAKNDKVIFLGQQVGAETFYGTLQGIDKSKRIEMPVAEELQMGMSIGLALEGYLPISIYQRMDFLPRACDQIVNHLDLIRDLSCNKFNPKVIIRTTIGSTYPMDVGKQHNKDLIKMFDNVVHFPIIKVRTPKEVHEAYQLARDIKGPIMIVEEQDLYSEPNT